MIHYIVERSDTMKILCLSDSHLENDILQKVTNHYPSMDMYIHCGDSSLPIGDLLLKKYLVVKGNHDEEAYKEQIMITIDKYRCLILHGNGMNVYAGYETLLKYMNKNKIDICFHGHTHIPVFYQKNNKIIINPGSVMINRASYGFGTYAIVNIEDSITVSFYHHTTFSECTTLALEEGKKTLQTFRQLINKEH